MKAGGICLRGMLNKNIVIDGLLSVYVSCVVCGCVCYVCVCVCSISNYSVGCVWCVCVSCVRNPFQNADYTAESRKRKAELQKFRKLLSLI